MFNHPTFHLEEEADYYERASYSWSSDSVRCISTASPHARANYLYVQECGYFKTAAPYFTERSALPSYLLLYCISGEGRLLYNHHTYPMGEGCCFYIDCMLPHRYEPAPKQNWEFLWLHFQGCNAAGYYREFTAAGSPVLQIQNTFLMESTLRRILSLQQKQAVHTEILTGSLITNLLTELILQKFADSHQPFRMPDAVQAVVSYLQAHYMEPLNLDTISTQVNVSKYHLSRQFSRYMGSSIHQFLISCRIQHAKELLRETSLSIEAISFHVGIGHVSHFIELFKNREGITPLEYRKLWNLAQ